MYTFKQKNSNSFLCFNVQSESLTYIDGFNNKEALMFSELLQAVNWLKNIKTILIVEKVYLILKILNLYRYQSIL